MISSKRARFLLVGTTLLAVTACTATGCRPRVSEAVEADPVPVAEAEEPVWPLTITDDLGSTVTLNAPPERIVSLSPAVTEMLFAVGAGDRVVGRTSYCDYPPEALEVPEVGTFTTPSTERVLELQPDLCIGVRGVSKDSIQALRSVGLRVIAYDPSGVEKALGIMERLGHLMQDKPSAVPVVDDLRARVEAVRVAGLELPRKPRILVGVQFEPLYAAGPGTHIHDMIEIAGGENTGADSEMLWPQYSLERMVENDPEVIVGTPSMGDYSEEGFLEFLSGLDGWDATTAVREGNAIMVADDILTLPGPRMVDGLEELAAIINDVAREVTAQ